MRHCHLCGKEFYGKGPDGVARCESGADCPRYWAWGSRHRAREGRFDRPSWARGLRGRSLRRWQRENPPEYPELSANEVEDADAAEAEEAEPESEDLIRRSRSREGRSCLPSPRPAPVRRQEVVVHIKRSRSRRRSRKERCVKRSRSGRRVKKERRVKKSRSGRRVKKYEKRSRTPVRLIPKKRTPSTDRSKSPQWAHPVEPPPRVVAWQ